MANPVSRRGWMRSAAGLFVPLGLAISTARCGEPAYEPLAAGGVPEELASTVKWIETNNRDTLFAAAAEAFAAGLTVERFLAAMLVAASRTLPLRPVGGWLHPLFTLHAAHSISLEADVADRLVPYLFSLDVYSIARGQDASLFNDWLTTVPSVLPGTPRDALRQALDGWDAEAADAAIVALYRTAPAGEVIEELLVYGCRDLAPIGHHIICVTQVLRTLQTSGWAFAEIPLRAVVRGLFESGAAGPTTVGFASARVRVPPSGWEDNPPDDGVTREVLAEVRSAGTEDAASAVAAILDDGGAPSSVLDGLLLVCAEMLLRFPSGGAVFPGFHALTNANGFRHVFRVAKDATTRYLAILQQAAFLPLERAEAVARAGDDASSLRIDTWEPGAAPATLEQVFEGLGGVRLAGAASALGWLEAGGSAQAFMARARGLSLTKSIEEHDYKLPVAVFEEQAHLAEPWRARVLAATSVYLRASTESDWSGLDAARAALALAGAR